jgi:hypothetical protein
VIHAKILPTEFSHIRELCENVRTREAIILARVGDTPEHFVTSEVAKSLRSWTGLANGKVICIWGIQTVGPLSEDAYVWLVCSEQLNMYSRTFLRHSREALETFRPFFKRVYGCVFHDFDKSARWLEWLGFSVAAPDPRGLRLFELRN